MRKMGNAAQNQRNQVAKIQRLVKSQQVVTFKDVAGAGKRRKRSDADRPATCKTPVA